MKNKLPLKLQLLGACVLLFCACNNKPEASQNIPGKQDSIAAVAAPADTTLSSNFSMPPTSKMMPVQEYWQLIAVSKSATKSLEEQAAWLQDTLSRRSPESIIGFRLRTDGLMAETYEGKLWCAAYIINHGASDEEFEYFRLWLIAQGSKVFEAARRNPDILAGYVAPGTSCQFEPLWYAPVLAFQAQTGAVLYDFIDKSFPEKEGYYQPIILSWREDDPESMRKLCPALFRKFLQ